MQPKYDSIVLFFAVVGLTKTWRICIGKLPALLQDLPTFLQSYEKAMLGLAHITEFVISSMEGSKALISVLQNYMVQLRDAVSKINQSDFVGHSRDAISRMSQSGFVGHLRVHPYLAAFILLAIFGSSVSFFLVFFACLSLSAVAMVPVFSLFMVVLATLMPMAICGIGALGCSLWGYRMMSCKYQSLKKS